MPKFYLSLWFVYLLAFVLFVAWIRGGLFFFGMIVFTIVSFALFRRKKVYLNDNQSDRKEVILSPVNGKIVEIKNDVNHHFFGEGLNEIRLIIQPTSEYGIFLPISGEIKDLKAKRGSNFFRYSRHSVPDQSKDLHDGICILIDTENRGHVGLQLIKCSTGLWPEVAVATGDRGKSRANIGYFPFGGTVLLYLPKNCEILVGINDNCVASETVLGAFNEGREI